MDDGEDLDIAQEVLSVGQSMSERARRLPGSGMEEDVMVGKGRGGAVP